MWWYSAGKQAVQESLRGVTYVCHAFAVIPKAWVQ